MTKTIRKTLSRHDSGTMITLGKKYVNKSSELQKLNTNTLVLVYFAESAKIYEYLALGTFQISK